MMIMTSMKNICPVCGRNYTKSAGCTHCGYNYDMYDDII